MTARRARILSWAVLLATSCAGCGAPPVCRTSPVVRPPPASAAAGATPRHFDCSRLDAAPALEEPTPSPVLLDALTGPGVPLIALHRHAKHGLSWSAVAWWICGRELPLHVARPREAELEAMIPSQARPIDGVLVSSDRRWLFVVHLGRRSYRGAIAPMSVGDAEVVAVDLATLEAHPLPLERPLTSLQSVRLAWLGSELHVQWRDTGNGSDDVRAHALCDPQTRRCRTIGAAPPAAASAPERLEVTSLAGYLLDVMPTTFRPPASHVPRTAHPSPDGRRIAFVTEEPSHPETRPALPPTRSLWIRTQGTQADVRVATGRSIFHARWLTSDELLYQPQEQPTALLEQAIAQRAGDPALAPIRERLTAFPSEDREAIWAFTLLETALSDLGARYELTDLLRAPLRTFDAGTNTDVEAHPGWARLNGHGPERNHRGRVVEVAAE